MKLNGLNCRASWNVNDTEKGYFKCFLKLNILIVHAKDKKNKEILELIQYCY